jgi:hypothetical protein
MTTGKHETGDNNGRQPKHSTAFNRPHRGPQQQQCPPQHQRCRDIYRIPVISAREKALQADQLGGQRWNKHWQKYKPIESGANQACSSGQCFFLLNFDPVNHESRSSGQFVLAFLASPTCSRLL